MNDCFFPPALGSCKPRGPCMMELTNKFDKHHFPVFSKSGTLIAQISKRIFDRQKCFQVKFVIPWSLFMDIENASGPM